MNQLIFAVFQLRFLLLICPCKCNRYVNFNLIEAHLCSALAQCASIRANTVEIVTEKCLLADMYNALNALMCNGLFTYIR